MTKHWKQVLAAVLAVSLLLSLNMLTVFAADNEEPSAGCSCTVKCGETSASDCPVCSASVAGCTGAAEVPDSGLDKPATPVHTADCARTDEHIAPEECMSQEALDAAAQPDVPAAPAHREDCARTDEHTAPDECMSQEELMALRAPKTGARNELVTELTVYMGTDSSALQPVTFTRSSSYSSSYLMTNVPQFEWSATSNFYIRVVAPSGATIEDISLSFPNDYYTYRYNSVNLNETLQIPARLLQGNWDEYSYFTLMLTYGGEQRYYHFYRLSDNGDYEKEFPYRPAGGTPAAAPLDVKSLTGSYSSSDASFNVAIEQGTVKGRFSDDGVIASSLNSPELKLNMVYLNQSSEAVGYDVQFCTSQDYFTFSVGDNTLTTRGQYRYKLDSTPTYRTIPANTVFTRDTPVTISRAGETLRFSTIAEAVASAIDGDTIDISAGTYAENLTIDKNLTLRGAGEATTKIAPASSADGVISVAGRPTLHIEGLTLEGSYGVVFQDASVPKLYMSGSTIRILTDAGMGIRFRQNATVSGIVVDLEDCSILNTKYKNEAGSMDTVINSDSRGISIFAAKESTVSIRNSEIKGFGYAINVSGPKGESGVADTAGLNVSVEGSSIHCWTSFNVWGSLGVYTISNSEIIGINISSGSTNSFSAITFNDDIYDQFGNAHAFNNTLTITDSSISNYQNGDCREELLRIDCGITKLTLRGTVNFTDTTGNISSALYLEHMDNPFGFLESSVDTAGAVVNCTSTVPGHSLSFAPTYVLKNTYLNSNGTSSFTYSDSFSSFIAGVDYEQAEASQETVILLQDIDESGFTVNSESGHGNEYGGWTLDLAGHTLTVAGWDADKVHIVDSSSKGTGKLIVNGKNLLVAQNGEKRYTSINAAIADAASGDTVTVYSGTYDEYVHPFALSNHSQEKSITLLGANAGNNPNSGSWDDVHATVLTGGMYIGYDDNHTRDNKIVIKGFTFRGKGLTVADEKDVIIENNKFLDITQADAVAVLDQEYDGLLGTVVVRNNFIKGVTTHTSGAGVNLRNPGVVVIEGNHIENTNHNSIVLQKNSKNAPNAGSVTISGNELINWDADNDSAGGRAMRLDFVGNSTAQPAKRISITENKLVKGDLSPASVDPNFVKVTGVGGNAVFLQKNYWNSAAPAFAKILTVTTNGSAAAGDGKLSLYPYYSDEAMTRLVYQPADNTGEQVAKIVSDLNSAIGTAVPGATIATVTEKQLNDSKAALQAPLTAATEALAAIDPAKLERYLADNPGVRAVVDKIYSAFTTVYKVEAIPAAPDVSPSVENVPEKKEIAEELTSDSHPVSSELSPAGLADAVVGTLPIIQDIEVFIKAEIKAVENPGSEQVSVTFEAKPYQKPADASAETATVIHNSQLNGKPITFYLPLPASIATAQVRVVHQKTGGGSETFTLPVKSTTANGVTYKYVEVTVREFSTFTVTPYVQQTSAGSANTDDREHNEYLFWQNIRDEIEAAEDGDVVYARAKDMTEVPVTVLRALYGRNLTLIISHGGEEYVINGKKMTKPEQNRIYYTFEQIDALYGENGSNPETGGVVNVPSVPVTPPAVVTPSVPEVPVEPPVNRPEPIMPVEPQPEVPAITEPAQQPERQMPALWIPIVIAFASMLLIGGIGFGIYRSRRQ